MHASSAGVGYCAPPANAPFPMRQMKPGPSWLSPTVLNPAACSNAYPLLGCNPQPRTVGPPQCEKSTATIAPVLVVQLPSGSAPADVTPATFASAPETIARSMATVAPVRLIGRAS